MRGPEEEWQHRAGSVEKIFIAWPDLGLEQIEDTEFLGRLFARGVDHLKQFGIAPEDVRSDIIYEIDGMTHTLMVYARREHKHEQAD